MSSLMAVAAIAGPDLPGFHLGPAFQAGLRAAPEPSWTTPDQRYVAERVIFDPWTSCWIWRRGLTAEGYGDAKRNGTRYAHRIAYEAFRGPIPDGMHIDHLCERRCCANPWHLEPVTRQENVRRGYRSDAESCSAGHLWRLYERWYTVAKTGKRYRQCGECVRLRRRAYRAGERVGVPLRASETECRNGHALTVANVYLNPDSGVVECRECRRGNMSRSHSARRLEELAYRAALLDRLGAVLLSA